MRPRPSVHFTPAVGWINDPHGIVYFGGEYHLFFQHNPRGTQWDKAIHWGHATSPDLFTWTEQPIALTPEGELGCWSGSAVVRDDRVTIAYTSIRTEDWSRGAVALAESNGSLVEWKRVPSGIDGPPVGIDLVAFRDPYVWRDGERWKALVGAGIPGVGGVAYQYSSLDLRSWTLDGPIATSTPQDAVWNGKVWECPQLIQIDGVWVLIVSVWDTDVLHYVAYADGEYDGNIFTPRQWRQLSFGPSAYATSVFHDKEGRPGIMSWLRERENLAPEGSPWTSAISAPFSLAMHGNQLQVRFMNVRSVFEEARPITEDLRIDTACLIAIDFDGDSGAELTLRGENSELVVAVDHDSARVSEDGQVVLVLPHAHAGPAHVEVLLDADILEITSSSATGFGAVRVKPGGSWRLSSAESVRLTACVVK